MKKILSLVTLLLCAVVSVWGDPVPGEANSTYLNLSKISTIETAGGLTSNKNASTLYLFDASTNWLTMSAYIAQQATSKQKWISQSEGKTGDEAWSSTGVFQGSTSYFSSGGTNCVVNSSANISFRITNCSEVRAIVKVRGNKRQVKMDIYEINAEGTRQGDAVQSKSSSTKSSTVISSDALDYSKIYEVYFYGSTSNNEFVQEVAFKNHDSRTTTSLAFASASYDATLGSSFDAPTATPTPGALTGITYSSSSEDVATVNATTGVVTLKAGGKTTITASFAGDETYKPSSASYTLNVTDPSAITISATWAMDKSSASVGVAGADETVMKMSWKYGSNMAVNVDKIINTKTYISFNPVEKKTSSRDVNSYVEFTMKPWKGLVFTPTNISFVAYKCGTSGGTVDVDFIDGAGTTKQLKTAQALVRDNASDDPTISATITGVASSSKEVTLRVYLSNMDIAKQMAIGNVVISGTASGTPEALSQYVVATSLNIDGAGTISPSIGDNNVYEGNDLSLTATAATGYSFVNWTIDGVAQTANPYTITNINEAHTAVANFKQLKSVTFAAGDGEGEVPATGYADEGEDFTVPVSYYLKKDGYTLTGWSDGTDTYKAGDKVTLGASNVTLTAVFEANTTSLDATAANTSVIWDFQKKNIGVFTSALSGFFVAQATVNGKTIDVPMAFDKQIPNASWNDWANTGNKPTLTIPATKGMKVTMLTYSNPSTTTIAGTTEYIVTGSSNPYTVTYTYDGTDATIDICLLDADYIRSITVEYPAATVTAEVTTYGWATFCSDKALDFTGITDVKAYIVTGHNEKAIEKTQMTGTVPANTPLLLEGVTASIPVAASSTTDVSANLLKAGTGAAVSAESGKTKYVLGVNGSDQAEFQKIVSTPATVAVGKAYLEFGEVISAPALSFDFSDMETTGINAVSKAQVENGEVYNLNGQRVSKPAKGLYIVNGKKVAIK